MVNLCHIFSQMFLIERLISEAFTVFTPPSASLINRATVCLWVVILFSQSVICVHKNLSCTTCISIGCCWINIVPIFNFSHAIRQHSLDYAVMNCEVNN